MFILILLIIFFQVIVIPAEALTLGDKNSYPLDFKILEDPDGSLTLDDVVRSNDFRMTHETGFGFTRSVIWAKFLLDIPENNQREWYLEIGYPLLNHIDIYIPDKDNSYSKRSYGDTLPFNERDVDYHNFLIHLVNLPGVNIYYLRVQTQSSLCIPLKVHSSKGIIANINTQKTIFTLFYGALLLILFYNLFLSFSMKDLIYLWYSLFIFSMVLVSIGLNGFGFQYFWPNAVWINDLIPSMIFFSIICLNIFSVFYINIKKISSLYYNVLLINTLFMAGGLIVSLFLPYHIMIILGAGSCIPSIIILSTFGFIAQRKKIREACFYNTAFFSLFTGVIITVLNRFGLLADYFATTWGFQIGTVISVALFSLGLADKVNGLKNNLEEINIHLEDMVSERTRELEEAKRETEEANEEMEISNEKLIETNRVLEKAESIHRKDLHMAASVQSSFLHKKPPESDLYDISYIYRPAKEVSGDFYDFYYYNDVLIGLGLFDVSGHGISAGLLTLMAKSIIEKTFIELRDKNLITVINTINKRLTSEIHKVDNYLTGIILRFKGNIVEYINCAHPDMICKKANPGKAGKIIDKYGKRISGPLLGKDISHSISIEESRYQEIPFILKTGDRLLIYTDSLTEALNRNNEEYGEINIINSFNNAPPDASANYILNYVMNDLYNFIGLDRVLSDDLTVVVLKRR